MHWVLRIPWWLACAALGIALAVPANAGPIRDGGIDPWNLGRGEWLYYMSSATNRLGGYVSTVTNEDSLMSYMKGQGVRYVIVKAATSDQLFKGSYSFPQFTSNVVDSAHANGLLIFGYNRSYGSNVLGEITISDYVFQQGADGFVWDAEAEWESSASWIGTEGPAKAWQLCSAVRSNWPNKFLAHSPFAIINLHSSFPYKEFGYWCDAAMPQIYHFSSSGLKRSTSAAINWTDVNWADYQGRWANLAPTNMNGLTVYWTNAIKPIVPIQDVYGPPYSSPTPDKDVMEFIDYLSADPNAQTEGGYQGANFFRADLHDATQWGYIRAGTLGGFPPVVNNIVMDDPRATVVGSWTAVRTFYTIGDNTPQFQGNGSGTDTNSFGTNYVAKGQGDGSAYVEFTPSIVTAGDYDVFQWHPYRTDASASVPFTINYSGGSATVYANQQTNSGQWTLLGRFNFAVGTGASIRVNDAVAEPNAVALVDGLKLVFVAATAVPPVITNQPQDASLLPGQAAVFAVAAAGTPPLYYQWRFNGGPIAGATDSVFTIGSAQASNVGPYCVVVTNAVGSVVSSNALLTLSWVAAAGNNDFGQINVAAGTTNGVALAAGTWHNLVLRADGLVVAWGDNFDGQCDVPPGLNDVVAIAAGGYHSLALKADGTVVAWGANDSGQANVPASLKEVVAIAAGDSHSLALKADGTVVAWGDNSWGQRSVPAGLTGAGAIAAGGNHSLALKVDGRVVAWGQNTDAEGRFAGQSVAPWDLTEVAGVAAGQYHSLAVRGDGAVVCWGDNSQGQCDVPAGATNVVAAAGGSAHSLALKADGSVLAWGADWNGQCEVPGGLTGVAGVGAGGEHTLLLLEGNWPPARLLKPVWHGGQFSSWQQTLARRNYALEFTGSLGETNWTQLPPVRGNGALRILLDPTATNSARFYRGRQW